MSHGLALLIWHKRPKKTVSWGWARWPPGIPSHLVFPVILWSYYELFLLEGDGELVEKKERTKLLLVSDSATKKFQLKLDRNRTLRGRSELVNRKENSKWQAWEGLRTGGVSKIVLTAWIPSHKFGCQTYAETGQQQRKHWAAIRTQHCLRLDLILKQTQLHLTLLPANAPHQVAGFYYYISKFQWQLFKQWSKAFDILSDTIYSLVLETGTCHRPSHKPFSWSRLPLDTVYLCFNCILYSSVNSDGHSES